MTDTILRTLLGLTRRERLLLAVLALVVLPVGAIFGIALPLDAARQAARQNMADARALDAWIADQALNYARLGNRIEANSAAERQRSPIGISGIEARLLKAGLRKDATELANSSDGGITLHFDAVRFAKLADWLSSNDGDWGYDLASFTFERAERDGIVSADLRLQPVKP